MGFTFADSKRPQKNVIPPGAEWLQTEVTDLTVLSGRDCHRYTMLTVLDVPCLTVLDVL